MVLPANLRYWNCIIYDATTDEEYQNIYESDPTL